jgi:ATP-binding cassette subfamily B protein
MHKAEQKNRARLLKLVFRGNGLRFLMVLVCILLSAGGLGGGRPVLGRLIDDYIAPAAHRHHPVFDVLFRALAAYGLPLCGGHPVLPAL